MPFARMGPEGDGDAGAINVERVEILERKVEALETLPARMTRVELQLVQLRDAMRAEFSAIRGGADADVTLGTLGKRSARATRRRVVTCACCTRT